ncbi:MAG: hypothetical protein HQL29_02900 [Candidatus Omnitrophica bacterium]|nr:hypothetical protein [Candidatus Omnitrophota bacterium]
MIQAILIMIAILLVIMFGLGNMHQTRVNLPLTGTFEVTTMFLLLLCFFLGYAAAVLTWCLKKIKDKKNNKRVENNDEKRKSIREY